MTGHLAMAAELAARADAAERCEPLEHSGARDPGPGTVPRREHLPASRRPPAAPHARIVAAARGGGHVVPDGTTREGLRTVWHARPELRRAIERMAAKLTTEEQA